MCSPGLVPLRPACLSALKVRGLFIFTSEHTRRFPSSGTGEANIKEKALCHRYVQAPSFLRELMAAHSDHLEIAFRPFFNLGRKDVLACRQ